MVYARALNARAGSTPSTPRLVRLPRVQIGLSEQHGQRSSGRITGRSRDLPIWGGRGFKPWPLPVRERVRCGLVPSEQLARDALEGGVRGVR